MRILFAGAGSLFGIKDIKKKYIELGIETVFLENIFMAKKLTKEDKENVIITDNYSFDNYNLVLPINEYWLSKCIKQDIPNISDKAKKASRDKLYFNKCLSNNGIKHCISYNYKEVCNRKGIYIIKPKYAFSGEGVSIYSNEYNQSLINSINFAKQGIINTEHITMVENEVTFWDYEYGPEYSTDIYFYKGKIYFIRVCEKVIRIINNRPCTIGYRLINPDFHMKFSIESWCKSVFDVEDISFAQFDFIKRKSDNDFIPIDFSSRIAGGLHTLLRQLDFNPYLNALLLNKYKVTDKYTQINLISKKSGIVISDDYNILDFFCYKNKRIGDNVTDNVTSGTNRLAEFICITSSRDDFEYKTSFGLYGDKYVS